MGQGGATWGTAELPLKIALCGGLPPLYQRARAGLAPRRATGWRRAMAAGQRGQEQSPGIEPLLKRLQGQINWYDSKAKSNQRAYKVSSIVVLAILIPVLAEYGHIPGFEGGLAFLVGVAAGAIVLLEGLQAVNKWQENW